MTPLRKAARECLQETPGAFLRCDRGESLYVTNAPALTERKIAWEEAGFLAQTKGKLTFLTPKAFWIEEFVRWAGEIVRKKGLALAVRNACFGEIDEDDMRLWIEGIKRLELHKEAAGYEKLVRQRAAVCLREKSGGGTIVACALIADLMNEGGAKDED